MYSFMSIQCAFDHPMVNFSRITSSYETYRLFYENLLSFVQVLKTIFPAAIFPHFEQEVGKVVIEAYSVS
jgi:hypothetical protein